MIVQGQKDRVLLPEGIGCVQRQSVHTRKIPENHAVSTVAVIQRRLIDLPVAVDLLAGGVGAMR